MSQLEQLLEKSAKLIRRAKAVVALTGAGISVESGIPAFRGTQGLWEKYDPMEYAHIDALRAHPERVWRMLRELQSIVDGARPNPAHLSLAKLEQMGLLRAIITQNIDHLHQEAGSRYVIEFHGSGHQLACLSCGQRMLRHMVDLSSIPPRCLCGGVLKPDVVFFGEPIPWRALIQAQEEAKHCDVMVVVGTSAVVAPACDMPYLAKERGARIIEVNTEQTPLTHSITDLFLEGPAGILLPRLVELLEAMP
ncbi:MAG: NAD-dependent protein deacylase [Thermodesulfobacteriota bacterium]